MSESSTKSKPKVPYKKDFVRHKVDYLGSLPISSKSTSLVALQKPLKDLYFKYRAMKNLGQTNLPGTLEINDTGLTVQYIRELHKGVQEIFNPFPTIAVWAAVKFIHKRDLVDGLGIVRHRFAFLPLISDPESSDKMRMFNNLEGDHEVELAADSPHPPIFACVMRRMTGKQGQSTSTSRQQQLECHGFVCTSSEDAILVAANLYQALLETMKKQKQKNEDEPQSWPPESEPHSRSMGPVRPPRRKKRGGRTGSGSEYSGTASVNGSILQRRRSTRSSIRSNRSATRTKVRYNPQVTSEKRRSPLARNDSRRSSRRSTAAAAARNTMATSSKRYSQGSRPQSGDVYTRVAIPRSKSFMNVNNQYNLQELFRELKEKEGVESIDDVLRKIISPDGISFNEIKPVYRELLLKLAMTMSQDEIFQRSKNILQQHEKARSKLKAQKEVKGKKSSKSATMTMEKNKKKSKKSNSRTAYSSQSTLGNRSNEQNTISSFFKMTFSSSKSKGQEDQGSGAKTDKRRMTKADIGKPVPLSTFGPQQQNMKTPQVKRAAKIISTPLPPAPVQPNPARNADVVRSKKGSESPEESSVDDAYASCSECGFGSVSCYGSSCRSAARRRPEIPPPTQYREVEKKFKENQDSSCDCETDSCIYSEKCYCSLRGDPRGATSTIKTRESILPPESCCCESERNKLSTDDSGTDTTCYSVRHIPVTVHKTDNGTPVTRRSGERSLSQVESPATAWRKNSSRIECSDTDCSYSDVIPIDAERPSNKKGTVTSIASVSSIVSSSSNCRLCQANHIAHHHAHLSDDSSSEFNPKSSGGSGYHSNEPYVPLHGKLSDSVSNSTSSSCCSCGSSCAGMSYSFRRSREPPRLSLARSQSRMGGEVRPRDRSLGDGLSKRNSDVSSIGSKVLVVSTVDKAGKVCENSFMNMKTS